MNNTDKTKDMFMHLETAVMITNLCLHKQPFKLTK